jgi:hypothetical protein
MIFYKPGRLFLILSVFLPVLLLYSGFIITGDKIMNSVHTWLRNLKSAWLNEPSNCHGLGPLYLTPDQRYALLKDLMMPVSESKKPGN